MSLPFQGLARATVPAAIMHDPSISTSSQKEHLGLEGIRRERPATAENHGLSVAPILVINLRAILGRHRALGVAPLFGRFPI
jgi:hypothetical protein